MWPQKVVADTARRVVETMTAGSSTKASLMNPLGPEGSNGTQGTL